MLKKLLEGKDVRSVLANEVRYASVSSNEMKKVGFKEIETLDGRKLYTHPDLDSHYQALEGDNGGLLIRSDKGRRKGDFGVSDTVSGIKEFVHLLRNFIRKDSKLLDLI